MADNTKIEWTDASWNPVVGCSHVSAGCAHCYAEPMAARCERMGLKQYAGLTRARRWTGKTRFVDSVIDQPLRWRKPRRIFVCSMGDLFHPSVPDEWIDKVFGVMHACEYDGNSHGDAFPWHVFQILTKRPERMCEYLSQDRRERWADWAVHFGGGEDPDPLHDQIRFRKDLHPRIWLGTTVEDSSQIGRVDHLLRAPATVRFLSLEPLLGAVDLHLSGKTCTCTLGSGCRGLSGLGNGWSCAMAQTLDWVIVGGESGPKARSCDLEWIRSVVEQCRGAGVACFVKQIQAYGYGRLTKDLSEWPEDLRVREMPEAGRGLGGDR